MAEVEPQVSTYGAAKWAGKPGPGLTAACAAWPVPNISPAAASGSAASAVRRRLSMLNRGRGIVTLSWRGFVLAGVRTGGSAAYGQGVVHCWLAAPVQSQICSRVPLAELGLVVFRQRPDAGLTSERFAPLVHCWAPVPLQSYSCTCVPLAVPAAVRSMHLPSARIVPSAPTVHCWALL